jgi:hypothetical protein
MLLKEGKDSAGNLGVENAYTLEQTISPTSTSIDQSSCTTNLTSIAKLGVSRAGGSN